MNRSSKTGIFLAVVFGLVMLVGLPYYIFSVMKKHSSSNAQDDAIVYMHNGKPVLATVLKKFQASSVSRGKGFTSVSGSSKLYAQAIDTETGKVLWSHRLKAENNRGQDWGDAVLLGQSSRYLFFLRNELYVISKETGEIVACNENLKDLQDVGW